MSRWFRFYDDAINDPKVQRLSADMFRAWVNMLCLASKYGGSIPKADIAFALRANERGAQAIVDCLVYRNLLDDMGDFVTPHNWDGRQYKSDVSNERVKRHRQRKSNSERNVTETVTVTPPEQNRDRAEQRPDSASAVHDEFLSVAGSDHDDPQLSGSLYGIQAMLSRGFSRETILAGAANAMRGKGTPPNWNYFAKCIESENEQRSSPAKKELHNGKPETLTDVARRMSAEVVGFGLRPSLSGGSENGAPVRLLSEGGRERS